MVVETGKSLMNTSISGTLPIDNGNVTRYVCPPSGFISERSTVGRSYTFAIFSNICAIDDRAPSAAALALICPEYCSDPPVLIVLILTAKL